jgi:3-oxoacyl-[acyl-carrier protein] reductase
MDHYAIIGSGSGIGAAVAKSLAAPGVGLLLHTGTHVKNLEAVAETCRASGAEVATCVGLTDAPDLFERVGDWAARVPENNLTGFVFAAGYAKLGTIDSTDPERLLQSFQAMPLAFHRLTALLAPKLADGRGRVVCISAFGAHRTRLYSYAPTAPAKAALEAQVRVFAANLAPRGIAVNAVVPGFIEKEPGTPSSLTPQQWAALSTTIPMGRVGQRDEAAALVRFLLSKDAGYITGQSIHVDGGFTL